MAEMIMFYIDDAIQYGEELAIVLGVLRKSMMFHDKDARNFDGLEHVLLSSRFLEVMLPYKPLKRIKTIIRKLHRLNIISVKNEDYYAVIT